jgi:PPOX class probable F420-dependent enzyme
MSSQDTLALLGNAWYVSLETFKRDGTGVKTPVWVTLLDGKLIVGTDEGTYKIKRARREPKVRVAVCDQRGKKILSAWYEGTARVVTPPESAPAESALDRKYSPQRRILHFFMRLFGRMKHPVIMEITVGDLVA